TGGALPTGLAALLLSRVERVSDAAQQVLRVAAVAGGGGGGGPAPAAPGPPPDPAPHGRPSHYIPGAFAASLRAGTEAERLGAPAEAHQHYDLALELWVRVEAAERIAGMTRGKLGLKSALAAAASGDVPRAVHLLRRIRDWASADAGPAENPESPESTELRCRVG